MKRYAATAAFVLAVTPVSAQQPPQQPQQPLPPAQLPAAQTQHELMDPGLLPDAATIKLPNQPFATLELSGDKKALKGSFSFEISSDDNTEVETLLNISASGPFDDKEKQSLLGDLDGLGNSATIGLAFERYHYDVQYGGGASTSGIFWGLGVEAGRKKYDYADPTTLAASNVSRTGKRYFATFGMLWPGNGDKKEGGMLSLRLRQEESFSTKPGQQICTPIADHPESLSCATLSLGLPEERDADILQVQYTNFGWGNDRLMIRPGISRDFENDITGVEVPLYLIREEATGTPSGGVKFSWRSDQDEMQVVLFISQPLNF